MKELYLPRLSFDRLGGVEDNPFARAARRPDFAEPMRICLHTAGLKDLNDEQRFIVTALCAPYRHRALKVFRSPGEAPPGWAEVPFFEVERYSKEAETLSIREGARRIETRAWLLGDVVRLLEARGIEKWPEREIIELSSAYSLEADMFVTAQSDILASRKTLFLDRYNVLSPHEAFPLIGVWSRGIGECHLADAVNIHDWYPWVLARALTPAAWPGYAALTYGERILTDGSEIHELASSVLVRLERLVTILDRMVFAWQQARPQGLALDLDSVVLGASAIQDNLALLAGRYFGIQVKQDWEWSLLRPSWQDAMRRTENERAGRLVVYVRGIAASLRLARELRQHAIHRALVPTQLQPSGERLDERIQLSARLLNALKGSLIEMEESPAGWGIAGERGPEWIPVTIFREGGGVERYKKHSEGSATLDPVPFAARLCALTARLIDCFFRIIDPASDPRLPDDVRTRALAATPVKRSRGRWDMFSPANARAAILSSPLSGLVDWVEPETNDSGSE